MRALLGVGVLAAFGLQTTTSFACVALSTWSVVDTVAPAAASLEVPLNAPILVHFNLVTNEGAPQGSAPPGYSVPGATLTRASSDSYLAFHTLPLARQESLAGQGPAAQLIAFVPDAPLLPNTDYAVRIGEFTEFSNPSMESPPTTWTFTTGSETRAPLRLNGELSVSFEAGLDPHMDCQIPLNTLCGGPSCTQNGSDDVTKARVQLPPAFDGYSDQFLDGKVSVKDAAADDSQISGLVLTPDLVAGEASELLLTVPLNDASASYVPCFTFSVTDARGDEASASWCADAPFPHPSANHGVAQLSSGRHTSTACSVSAIAPAGAHEHGVISAVLAALALMGLRRRRSAL